jgi:hypothetical protein
MRIADAPSLPTPITKKSADAAKRAHSQRTLANAGKEHPAQSQPKSTLTAAAMGCAARAASGGAETVAATAF